MAINNKVNSYIQGCVDRLEGKTLKDIYNYVFTYNKKKVAVEYFNEKGKIKHYKYAKVQSNILSFASNIQERFQQCERHRPVILKFSNNQHWPEVFWALVMSGYKPLLIDAKTSKEGTQNLINQAQAVGVISEDPYQYTVKKISVFDLLAERHVHNVTPDWENEVIFSSSGTTGDVKLMVVNGENMYSQICCAINMGDETKDIIYPDSMGKIKILAMIPFHHVFGFLVVFLWYTFFGKVLVFPTSTAPSDLQSACKKMGVTHAYSVPLLWNGLAQGLKRKAEMDANLGTILDNMIKYNLGEISKQEAGLAATSIARNKVQKALLGNKIKYCISGGGFVPEDTLKTINGIGYNLYNGYGMTEVGIVSVELSSDIKDRIKGSIGHPFNGVSYKIDGENGKGELLIKSPTVHIREIIGGVEKEATLTEDQYFRSGDIAEVDADGRYYLKGRIKDIIINADGENIFPDELEIYFQNLPHVIHYSVMGIANNKGKEETVSIVLELDNTVTDEVIAELKERIHSVKLPHDLKVETIYLAKTKLPLANGIKVKRFVIKKMIEAGSNDFIPLDKTNKVDAFEGFDEETTKLYVEPVREMFSKILILPKYKIANDAHWINDLGGDSMSYVELIRDLQEKFEIVFPEETLGKMENVNDFVSTILKLKKDNK